MRFISPSARAALLAYDWPGNVRELENAIERAVVLGSDEFIQPEDLPEAVLEVESAAPAGAASADYHEAVKEAKKLLILRACEQSDSFVEAARLLNVHPNYLLLRGLRDVTNKFVTTRVDPLSKKMKQPLAPNTAIAHYRLLARLCAGGTGEVYMA